MLEVDSLTEKRFSDYDIARRIRPKMHSDNSHLGFYVIDLPPRVEDTRQFHRLGDLVGTSIRPLLIFHVRQPKG